MKERLDVHIYKGKLIRANALFSEDLTRRYELIRLWGIGDPVCGFIGLNPSIADEKVEDPTIRRCMGFAKDWGYTGIVMLNAYPLISTIPQKDMKNDIFNDLVFLKWRDKLPMMVGCWGTQIDDFREKEIKGIFPNLHVLKLTKNGHPSHPLYLPKSLKPVAWSTL